MFPKIPNIRLNCEEMCINKWNRRSNILQSYKMVKNGYSPGKLIAKGQICYATNKQGMSLTHGSQLAIKFPILVSKKTM